MNYEIDTRTRQLTRALRIHCIYGSSANRDDMVSEVRRRKMISVELFSQRGF
jgi:hypothetical protein